MIDVGYYNDLICSVVTPFCSPAETTQYFSCIYLTVCNHSTLSPFVYYVISKKNKGKQNKEKHILTPILTPNNLLG
jgi:hypothetical protein